MWRQRPLFCIESSHLKKNAQLRVTYTNTPNKWEYRVLHRSAPIYLIILKSIYTGHRKIQALDWPPPFFTSADFKLGLQIELEAETLKVISNVKKEKQFNFISEIILNQHHVSNPQTGLHSYTSISIFSVVCFLVFCDLLIAFDWACCMNYVCSQLKFKWKFIRFSIFKWVFRISTFLGTRCSEFILN